MTTTFSDTTDLQGIFQHTKFISGQDSLNIKDFTRLANYALDDYSYLAITSSGQWKFDDSTYTTHPSATRTVNSGQADYDLDTTFLTVDSVQLLVDGKYKTLEPIDRKNRTQPLTATYATNGQPEAFDFDGESIFLYPTPSQGYTMKVFFSRAVQYFDVTDTTATIGIPRIHHEYIALHASHRLTLRTNDPNRVQIRDELMQFEKKIRDFYSKRDMTQPRRLKGNINVAQ
jgi:hypothetical protein